MSEDEIELTAIALIERNPTDSAALTALLPNMTGLDLAAILGAVLGVVNLITHRAPGEVAAVLDERRSDIVADRR